MKKEMKNKIKNANIEIQKVITYIEENRDMFDSMNLKLHEASYYSYSKLEQDFNLLTDDGLDYFYRFCDDSFRMFEEDLKESYNIDFRKYQFQLGRTSSFYLHDRNIVDITARKFSYADTIYQLLYKSYTSNVYISLDDDGIINSESTMKELETTDNEDYINIINDELDYITDNLYSDLIDYITDIEIIYDYIKLFKENQVKYFKEYLEQFQEEKEFEQKQENEQRDQDSILLDEIIEKYNIGYYDMDILKEVIYMYRNDEE